jgi:hypothetical protein
MAVFQHSLADSLSTTVLLIYTSPFRSTVSEGKVCRRVQSSRLERSFVHNAQRPKSTLRFDRRRQYRLQVVVDLIQTNSILYV